MKRLIGWIILAVILLILLLLLFTPFGVSADYSGGALTVAARVFCFDLKLYPPAAKKAGKERRRRPRSPRRESRGSRQGRKRPNRSLLQRIWFPSSCALPAGP